MQFQSRNKCASISLLDRLQLPQGRQLQKSLQNAQKPNEVEKSQNPRTKKPHSKVLGHRISKEFTFGINFTEQHTIYYLQSQIRTDDINLARPRCQLFQIRGLGLYLDQTSYFLSSTYNQPQALFQTTISFPHTYKILKYQYLTIHRRRHVSRVCLPLRHWR